MAMKTYNILEFIEYTKQHPYEWLNYCEVVILRNGTIMLARPSHQESIIQYIIELENTTREDINSLMASDLLSPMEFYVDKYGLVAVWNNTLIASCSKKLNRFQKNTVSKLVNSGLILKNYDIRYTKEYMNFLYRQSLKGES